MNTRRSLFTVVMLSGAVTSVSTESQAQCCLTELFSGCRKAPAAYAVAPVAAPVVAPVAAPIPAPPPPVMVPVQQVSYVPETTYRTQYQCVPVTSYKPSCEIDPCTGCQRECMEQVTQYVQQPVNVPVTQYRAVYTTKYVQMQPGYGAAGAYAAPQATPGVPLTAAPATGSVQSPFASSVQTTPQAWGAAGADVSQQMVQPGQQNLSAPQLPPATVVQPGFQQQIVPQAGTYAAPAPSAVQPQPTAPPMLSPTPALRPIPELPRSSGNGGQGSVGTTPHQTPIQTPSATGTTNGGNGMPVLPGTGPTGATSAFPKLLEPTGHTTFWQPGSTTPSRAYPTAALPGHLQ